MNQARAILLLATMFPLAAFGQDCVPSEALWAQPRSGAAIVADSGVRDCVAGLLAMPAARLTVRHLPDEEAASRAAELRWWLIALGVAPARIGLSEEISAIEPLVLELTEPK